MRLERPIHHVSRTDRVRGNLFARNKTLHRAAGRGRQAQHSNQRKREPQHFAVHPAPPSKVHATFPCNIQEATITLVRNHTNCIRRSPYPFGARRGGQKAASPAGTRFARSVIDAGERHAGGDLSAAIGRGLVWRLTPSHVSMGGASSNIAVSANPVSLSGRRAAHGAA
jgi:hypothetical protein